MKHQLYIPPGFEIVIRVEVHDGELDFRLHAGRTVELAGGW